MKETEERGGLVRTHTTTFLELQSDEFDDPFSSTHERWIPPMESRGAKRTECGVPTLTFHTSPTVMHPPYSLVPLPSLHRPNYPPR